MPGTAHPVESCVVRVAPLLPQADALRCDGVEVSEDRILLHVSSCAATGRCPNCDHASRRVNGWYARTLTDLPWHGRPVTIRWRSRKFRCGNPACSQRIFTERLPAVAASGSRRTQRLDETFRALAVACGGDPGARLASRLGMPISGDGLLRILRRHRERERPPVRVLGVDDFAFRKGLTYGTILCDLERGRPIDLLPERSKESFRDWLGRHPGVEVVSRDRGEPFAQGAAEGAPQACHVADRWYLLANLRDAAARWFGRTAAQWRPHLGPPTSGVRCEVAASRRESPAEQLRQANRQQRRARYEQARELHRAGWDYRRIGRRLGIHANTVRKFVEADEFPERVVPRRARATDPFAGYLRQRWEAGVRIASVLFEEVKRQGFQGSYDAVCDCVAPWRAPRDESPRPLRRPLRCSADQLSWLVVQRPDRRNREQEQFVETLAGLGPSWDRGIELVRQFVAALRREVPVDLDEWTAAAVAEAPREVQRFAQGLLRDRQAVVNALTSRWSNGPTEGHVKRLKLIKRQMYGRARFDLLRIRFLESA
ncbi:MAG: ISL3 family transposase [Planctomycetaceae bacterium]|nr:ISL3 family transposase [Planctomycetaceae bacterium]